MDLRTKKPWKLMLRGMVLASSVALLAVLILLLGGKPLVSLIFGKEFLGAYPILMVLIIAPVIGIFTFPLPPMLYSLDRPDGPLKAKVAATAVYFLAVFPLALQFGVIGASVAYVIGYATMAVVLFVQLRREYRRLRSL